MAQQADNKSGFWKTILLLLIAAAVLSIAPAAAETGVTIAAQGDQSYYLGEEVTFSGHNYDSDSTFLFITGPGISRNGGKLTAPLQNVAGGVPGSFDRVKTNPDKSWEYTLYTYSLGLNPGPYSIHAVSKPKSGDQLTAAENKSVRVIFKKPFITAGISPLSVTKGTPFSVSGSAEGNPDMVQLWIIGDNYVYTTTTPTNPDSSYTFSIDPQTAGKLPKGDGYLIVQHPMQDTRLDIVASGDYVKSLKLKTGSPTGTNLFRITGAGSLQGSDAKQALIAALNDPAVDDTYTEIPVVIAGADIATGVGSDMAFSGTSTLQAQAAAATPVQHPTESSPLLFAPVGAIVLITIFFLWRRC